MKRLIAGIVLLGTLTTFAQAQIPPEDRMVIVISLDGLPGFALEDAKQPAPTLRRLMREGTWALWTKAASYLIKEHKPNLLLFHLLTLDATHHRYGPKTLAGSPAMAFLDCCVAQVVEAVHEAGMADRTTFLVVSDHGFKAYTNEIRAAVALEAAGLAKAAYVQPEGGTGFLYLNATNSPEASRKVLELLKFVEGIADVIPPERFGALGLPIPQNEPQMFDVLLTAKSGCSFSGATGGAVTAAVPQQAGSHGYLASDPDLDAIFIATGYGVNAGAKLGEVRSIDVAPTIAKLLSLPLPTAKGKALHIE